MDKYREARSGTTLRKNFQNTNSNRLGVCVSFVTFFGRLRRIENVFTGCRIDFANYLGAHLNQSRRVEACLFIIRHAVSRLALYLVEKDTVIFQCCYHAKEARNVQFRKY